MKELTLLIGTCDSYSMLWDNFVTLTNRYWQYECDKIFLTENKTAEYEGYRWVTCDRLPWSDRMLMALSSIDTEYTFFILEDYYFTEPITAEEIQLHIDYMKSVGANKIMLEVNSTRAYSTVEVGRDVRGHKILRLTPESTYLTSIQPSIWKTSFLRKCMLSNWSPWEFEIVGTQVIQGHQNKIYMIDREKKPYWNAVRKGLRLSAGWEHIKHVENLKDINL